MLEEPFHRADTNLSEAEQDPQRLSRSDGNATIEKLLK
jgi:hypothetical protein